MSPEIEQLLEQALKLPQDARAALAGSLIESLDDKVDEGAEAAWATEIEKRVREIDSGSVATVPWSEVRGKILNNLNARRQN